MTGGSLQRYYCDFPLSLLQCLAPHTLSLTHTHSHAHTHTHTHTHTHIRTDYPLLALSFPPFLSLSFPLSLSLFLGLSLSAEPVNYTLLLEAASNRHSFRVTVQ